MKVVVPAAGLGTRFFPATKSQPKEMLPVLDKPIIQYVVEEAVAAGGEDILIVTGRGKRAIEDHLDPLTNSSPNSQHQEIQRLNDLVRSTRIHFVRQAEPAGLADAIACARHHTGDDSFGVLLGDTINICEPPLLSQLWEWHKKLNGPVIAVEEVDASKVSDYGIVSGQEVLPGVVRCEKLVEKPTPEATPSRLGITGAYILTPDIYDAIAQTPRDLGGEIQLTDSLQLLAMTRPVFAVRFRGLRYDIGTQLLWLKTNLEFALRDPRYSSEILKEIQRHLSNSRHLRKSDL